MAGRCGIHISQIWELGFALGLLNKLDVKRFRVQTVVLCPTRELADQVATEIRKLARGIHNIKVLTLCGGVAFGPQVTFSDVLAVVHNK